MKFLLALVLILSANEAFTCTEDGKEGFLPKNKLNIPVGYKGTGILTHAQFNAAIDKVEKVYSSVVSGMGGDLKIVRNWDNGTVNAYATKTNFWEVHMFGGLARHASITQDGLTLVLCHELGHLIGGSPRVSSFTNNWASNEGQSDYFATLKCLRRVWEFENNEQIVEKMDAPKILIDKCSEQHLWSKDFYICIRGAMAGVSVANLFHSISGDTKDPDFSTPDKNVVNVTFDKHPANQCRLDTYLQGALCEVSFHEDLSYSSEATGACHAKNGHKVGLRPKCWFKSEE